MLRPTEKLEGWLFAVSDLEGFKIGLKTPKEAASLLGTDSETFDQLIRERKLKAIVGTSQQGEKLYFLLRRDIEGLAGMDRR